MGQHVYKLLPQHPQLLLPLLCMGVMSHNSCFTWLQNQGHG